MKTISKRALTLYAIILIFLAGCGLLFYNLVTNSSDWAMNRVNKHLYSSGNLATAGDVKDANGVVLATTQNGVRVYNQSKNIRLGTLHTVGDNAGFIASGIQTSFKDELTGYTLVDGVYNLKRYGKGNDVTLTINSNICATAYKALGDKKGTVAVMNYKTGELICVVSTPTYDILNKPDDILTDTTGKYDGIYLNRFFSGLYTPGSTFKVITAACAIENIPDIYTRTFKCEGKVQIGEGYVICSGTHGEINFEKAMNKSCNCAFAVIADELGSEKLTATAERLGFNTKNITISDKIKCAKSKLNLSQSTALDIGWAGIGQYTTLINPCQMLTMISAVVNGGSAVSPYLVSEIENPEGDVIFSAKTQMLGEFFSPSVAQSLDNILRSNVKNQYGDSYFYGMNMCGKTGTAEISDDENAKPNALFIGYSKNEDMPFAIIVVVEETTSAIKSAVPIASRVMKEVKAQYVK
jgi:peptidoglycan glycosyltransferase